MTDDRSLLGACLGALTAITLAMVLVGIRGEVASANIALALVIPVVIAGAAGGRWAGGATALVAALSFDFFHTRPYLSLKITSAADLESTVLLLVLGLLTGQLAARALPTRHERREHLEALNRFSRIAEQAVRGDVADDIASGIAAELISELGLVDCWYEPAPFLVDLPRIEANGLIDETVHRLADDGFELPRGGAEIVVMRRQSPAGRFVLKPTPGHGVSLEQRLVALALASQLAIRLADQAA